MDNKNVPEMKAHSHGANESSTVTARPIISFELADFPIPTRKDEVWRFTPLARIEALFEPANYTQQQIKATINAPKTVIVEQVARSDQRVGLIGKPYDRAAVVAWHASTQAIIITIPANEQLTKPVIVDVLGEEELLYAQHIVVRAEQGSTAIVVVNHLGIGKLNQTIEIDVADDANLTFVSIQEWQSTAVHASSHRIKTGRASNFTHLVVTLGGDLVRINIDDDLDDTDSDTNLYGLYYVDAHQHLEHRIFISHNAAHCKSRVTYKGALQGQDAHAVWVGNCLIDTYADGTDTYELNRNLVLTKNTKVNSVPNLEIKNGEIEGAGHASATGRFDDQQLFYLMARGIDPSTAKRLVVRGFFAELIHSIGIKDIQEKLMLAIEEELKQTGN